MPRSQTSTEYLIILAMVIIIALIVVSSLGGLPGIGGGSSRSSNLAILLTQEIGVKNYHINASFARFELRNNVPNNIRLGYIRIGGYYVNYSGGDTIALGESISLSLPGSYLDFSQENSLVPDIEIEYTDLKSGASFTTEGLAGRTIGTVTSDGVDDYIYTGIQATSGVMDWEIVGSFSTTAGTQMFGQSDGSDDYRDFYAFGITSNRYAFYIAIDSASDGFTQDLTLTPDTNVHTLLMKEAEGMFLDGTKILGEPWGDGDGGTYHFMFDDQNDGNTPTYTAYTLQQSRIWLDDELVSYLVPQPDGTLLDLIDGKGYCNQGNCGGDQLTPGVVQSSG